MQNSLNVRINRGKGFQSKVFYTDRTVPIYTFACALEMKGPVLYVTSFTLYCVTNTQQMALPSRRHSQDPTVFSFIGSMSSRNPWP